jgi:hypothetical protein
VVNVPFSISAWLTLKSVMFGAAIIGYVSLLTYNLLGSGPKSKSKTKAEEVKELEEARRQCEEY